VTGFVCQYLGWRWAFALPGFASAAIGVAFMARVRHEVRTGHGQARAAARVSKGDMRRVVLALVLTVLAGSTAFNAVTVALPKLFTERLADLTTNPAAIGLIAAGVYVFGALAQYTVGGLIDRHALKIIFLPLALLLTPLFYVGATRTGIPLIVVAIGLIIAIFGLVTVIDSMIGKYTSEEWRARAYAARYFLGFACAGGAVALVAWLHQRGGFALMLETFAAMSVFVVAGALVFPSEERAPEEAAQPAE
jgi:predicted MFS family arabinose efflux permease